MSNIKRKEYIENKITELKGDITTTNAKITDVKTDINTLKEDVANGFSQDMVDAGIQKKIADGTIANMTIEDAIITGDKLADNTIEIGKLSNEAQRLMSALSDNLEQKNFKYMSHAYTNNITSGTGDYIVDEDNIYTATIPYDSSYSNAYMRLKLGNKAIETTLGDSLVININSTKEVSLRAGLIFGGNWSKGTYCFSELTTIPANGTFSHTINFSDEKFITALGKYGDEMLEVAIVLKGLGVDTNTTNTYEFKINSIMYKKPNNSILYSVNAINAENSKNSDYALASETANTSKESKHAINSNNSINAGVESMLLDYITPKYTTSGKEDILSGKIPLINNGAYIEFNKTMEMVCDHYYCMFIEVNYNSLKDLDKTLHFNLKYLDDNITEFNVIRIVKTKGDWYDGNLPLNITTEFKQGEINLYEKIYNSSKKDDYSALNKFYINIAYYNGTTEDKYSGTITHCTIAPYFESGGIVIANKITSELKEEIIKEIETNGSNEIVCWGDSLTAMGGWTTKLAELSGMTVVNAGVGGETSTTIMSRQGGDAMIVNNITIPADTTAVQIATRTEKIPCFSGGYSLPLLQGGGGTINPCTIKGIEGTLKWTGSAHDDMTGAWTFTRTKAGEEVVINRPTPIITKYMRNKRTPKVLIIFMGQNGGWGTDPEALVKQHKLVIDYANNPEYFILGLSSGTKTERADYEKVMKEAFGRRFFSLREYLSQYGLDDLGIVPTDEDNTAMAEGKTPPSLLIDAVHFNSQCRELIGKLIYERLTDLNIL